MGAIEPAAPRDVAAAEAPAAVAPARCKNCGAVLLGRFCVDCSQAAHVHVPSTMELVHELLKDSRIPILVCGARCRPYGSSLENSPRSLSRADALPICRRFGST